MKKRPHGWGRIDKLKSGYVVRWYDGTKDRHRSVAKALGVRPDLVTAAMAHDLLDQLIMAKKSGTSVLAPARMTVAELLQAYVEELEGRGAKSVSSLRNESQAVVRWMGDEPLARLTTLRLRALVKEYRAVEYESRGQRRRYQPATIKNRLGLLHAAMEFGHESLELQAPPRFPEIAGQRIRKVVIQEAEYLALRTALRAVDPGDDIVEFLYWTGWRASECLKLEWARVDLEAWTIELDADETKTSEPRRRPIVEEELRALLLRRWESRSLRTQRVFHRGGLAISYSWMSRTWRRACMQVGIADRRLHDFRRGLYSRLSAADVDTFTSMELAGHKSLSVAKRYSVIELGRQTAGLQKEVAHRKMRADSRATRASEPAPGGDRQS